MQSFADWFSHFEDRLTDERKGKSQYFVIYTLVFFLTVFLVFSWYFLTGRTFIWKTDGWYQHFKALVYYARYLRSIIKGVLFQHKLVIPTWDFSFGEGGDLLQTLHYYAIGDPFNVLSVLVPTRFMYIYYDTMVLARLYFAGIAFSFLCFETGQKSRYAVLAGSVSYVFCFWAILNAARHPYFLNPMIYLPMLILGVEKICNGKRPYLFILTVMLSALSNFYFFYMLAIITALYVVVRILLSARYNIKTGTLVVIKLCVFSVLGLLMAFCIFLPVFFNFISDSRMGVHHPHLLFYPLSYYSRLPGLFLARGMNFWSCMGFASPVLLSVLLLFCQKRKKRLLKCLFLIALIMLIFPIFGQALNGFSYTANRWTWAFALLSSYIFVVMWPPLMNLTHKESSILFLCLTAYFTLCMLLTFSREADALSALGIALLFLMLILPHNWKHFLWHQKGKQAIALLLVMISVANVSFWHNSPDGTDYPSLCKATSDISRELFTTEATAVKQVQKQDGVKSFYRYSDNVGVNSDIISRTHSTKYYWSISNPHVSSFRSQLAMREPMSQLYKGYDERTALLTLSSCRYYVSKPEDLPTPKPYGFSFVDTINIRESYTNETLDALKKELRTDALSDAQNEAVISTASAQFDVYRNRNPLPLGYTYDGYIPLTEWEKLSEIEKQEALLSGIVLSDYTGTVPRREIQTKNQTLNYSVKCKGNEISLQGNSFVVTAPNATATFYFKGLKRSETYFTIRGLDFQGTSQYDLYHGDKSVDPLNLYNETGWKLLSPSERAVIRKDHRYWVEPSELEFLFSASNGVTTSLDYLTESSNSSAGRHDFAVNFGYSKGRVKGITVKFPYEGRYSFDSIDISCLPMKGYSNQVKHLKEDVLDHVEIGENQVSGTIDLDKPKLLCLSIPYSQGWTAYVDGKKADLLEANVMYMALDLTPGTHKIELKYHTPHLRTGVMVSVASIVIFVSFVLVHEKRKRKERI